MNEGSIGFIVLPCALALLLGSCTVLSQQHVAEATDFTQYVDPFIGTGGTGHTFPGATVPFGLVQLSPHTGNFDWAYHSGYQFADTTLRGFAHTHLSGGGVPALGDVLMLPFATDESLDDSAVRFSKSRERASPGYYGTYLPDSGIEVELTATARTGVHRYTFDSAGSYHVLINIDEVLFAWGDPDESKVQEAYFVIENDTTVSGYLRPYVKRVERPVYFTIRLSKPFAASRYLDEPDNRELLLDYTMEAADQLEARVALSTVSIDGAKKNLAAESADRPFESIRADAAQRWNTYLSRARIEGTPAQKAQFYTSLYHLFIQPNNLADVDGRYSGADDEVHRVPSDEMYSTFAFWDTYRAAHPLYTLLIPEKVEPFITSVLRHADEVGYLPVWPLWGRDSKTMIGNHSVPVIVDAYLKGLVDADPDKAFEAIKTTLTRNSWEKYDWSLYDRYGYLPSDTVTFEAVSRTLEATYDDWSAAQMARMLGRHEDAAFFARRSEYYRNLFDARSGFFRGRIRDGSWVEPFDPLLIKPWGSGDYTEANAWQYLFHVQHDVPGLIELMGGEEAFVARLDTLFGTRQGVRGESLDVTGLLGQYAHGNEPSQHVAYLYNYADRHDRTQERIRTIVETMYDTTPEGYSGNNDFGQMSAWYVFSTLGFYPVHPTSGVFDVGIPLHEYAAIRVGEKTWFTIRADDLSEQNQFVASVTLNGNPLYDMQITYDEIVRGGALVFEMTDQPGYE